MVVTLKPMPERLLFAKLMSEDTDAQGSWAPSAEAVNDRAKLTMHRLIARALATDAALVSRAKETNASRNGDFVDEWRDVLEQPVIEIRRLLIERSSRMTRLRLSSPFTTHVDLTDESFRRRIWRNARRALSRRT